MVRFVLCCRGKVRYLLLTGIAASVIVLLYQGLGGNIPSPGSSVNDLNRRDSQSDAPIVGASKPGSGLSAISSWLFSAVGSNARPSGQCPLVKANRDVDINTIDLYPTLNFKPEFRNYWNHSFDKRYLAMKEDRKKDLPLKVIVLPHSHNDPGWLKTFDGYFLSYTAFILNNMADRLNRYRDMSFVWSEISYFAKWWDSLKNRPQVRETVKELVQRGQLEMVTGGWVMTDEAAAHYYAMVDQLIEGQQWLKTHLGVVPTNGWSIDPFGHSSTVPYLLKAAGIKNMVIQRTHYAWKQYLAERQQLEFYWKQLFDHSDTRNGTSKTKPDILCHMAPFDLYSIKHTCGPDQDVCLQFDFRRVSGEYSESTAVQINLDNVEEKAKLLLGQYGRTASLFPHNVAVVYLGDDFRFNHDVEWDQQYSNYKLLFDHINNNKDMNSEVKFGTLEDYFGEVKLRMAKIARNGGYAIPSTPEMPLPVADSFPSLVGDFLPYGDIYAEARPSYWTGYFTTRPYWKHMSRELEYWLRSAEILYSLCRTVVRQKGNARLFDRLNQDYVYITTARDSLGLFQHHDAITGTSKAEVMHDYGMRMYRGIREAIGVVSHAVQYVMLKEPIKSPIDLRPAHPMTSYLFPDVSRTSFEAFPQKSAYAIPKLGGRKIVLFNSLLHAKQELIRVMVKNTNVKVIDANNQELQSQINPSWKGSVEIQTGVFELVFVVDLPPLSLQSLTLLEVKPLPASEPDLLKPTVSVFVNDAFSQKQVESVFSFINPSDEDIVLESPLIIAVFCKQTGLLKEMRHKNDAEVKTNMKMSFQAYKAEDFRSGAYLFAPNRLQPILNVTGRFPIIRVIRGPLVSEVTTVYPGVVTLSSKIYHVDGILGAALEMTTIFDLTNFSNLNLELFMRFETDVLNENTFYTDSNGFQMIQRTSVSNLPVEANYYPITTAAYIEDSVKRLTLLVSHAHGATGYKPGFLEVMLDRKFRFDDSRGLGEGVLDNKKTMAPFWLVLEKQEAKPDAEDTVPSLSLLSNTLSEMLNYPPNLLVSESGEDRPLESSIDFLEGNFPCDYHLMNLRTLPVEEAFHVPSNASLLVLHRKGTACHVTVPSLTIGCKGSSNATVALKNVRIRNIHRTSLTGVYTYEELNGLDNVTIPPMNLDTYTLRFA